jgi:hypothetical protein
MIIVLERLSHIEFVSFVHLDALCVHGWRSWMAANPVNEEWPLSIISVEPISDMFLSSYQFENEFEIDFHPFEVGLVHFHDLNISLKPLVSVFREINMWFFKYGLKQTQERSQIIKIKLSQTLINCFKKLLNLIRIIIGIVTMSLNNRPNGSISFSFLEKSH